MKANWSCTECGMYSSRRYSVERHLKNLHKGQGVAIPFVEYLVGRTNGSYPPGQRPAYGSRSKASIREKMEEEAENIFVRRVAEQTFPPPGDPTYIEQAKMLKTFMLSRIHSNFK